MTTELSKELRSVGDHFQVYKDEYGATYLKVYDSMSNSKASEVEWVFQEVIIDDQGHVTIGWQRFPENMVIITKPKIPPIPPAMA